MNHIIPCRNERSTCSLYMPLRLSLITVPNQPNIMNATSPRPSRSNICPEAWLLNQLAAPTTPVVNATLATIGQ